MNIVCSSIVARNLGLFKGELPEICPVKVHDVNLSLNIDISKLFIDHIDFERSWVVLCCDKYDNIFVCLSSPIMKSLPLTVVVNGSPGINRPHIVDLPIERSHAVRSISSQSLYSGLNCISLKNHGRVDKALEIFRGLEVLRHIMS